MIKRMGSVVLCLVLLIVLCSCDMQDYDTLAEIKEEALEVVENYRNGDITDREALYEMAILEYRLEEYEDKYGQSDVLHELQECIGCITLNSFVDEMYFFLDGDVEWLEEIEIPN